MRLGPLLAAMAFVAISAMPVRSQSPPTQKLAFEVASIKPTQAAAGSPSGIASLRGGRIIGRNVTLKRCIRGAYDIPETLIFGGPKWVDEDRYDIDAKADGPAGNHDMMIMLQSLLDERFHLVFHREQRQISGYSLVVAKTGLKAEPSAKETEARTDARRGSIDAQASTMANLAQKLSDALRVPVTDFTGTEGRFNFKLSWNPEDAKPLTPDAASKPLGEPPGPSIFAALQEQLGLKLESAKGPVEVLIIDSVRKPTEN
jgi:uncharacterized protein (TIGR03435 family)